MSLILIKRSYHTEKSLSLNDERKYTFIVDKKANKVEIKKQIAEMYNVLVESVNTSIQRGKKVARYTRKQVIKGKRSDYKKAVVTVAKGEIIDTHADNI